MFVGIYDDHNSGFAAVAGGRISFYQEFERLTRKKNQAGWSDDLLEASFREVDISKVEAISVPDANKLRRLLKTRFGSKDLSLDEVVVDGRVIRIEEQVDRHALFHVLANTAIPLGGPGIYFALVFDAEQPRLTWIDLRTALTSVPVLNFKKMSQDRWYNGAIFADLFGNAFYGNGDLSNCGKLMGLAAWGTTRLRHVRFLEHLAKRHFDEKLEAWQGYRWVDPDAVQSEIYDYLGEHPDHHEVPEVLDLASSAQALFTDQLLSELEVGCEEIRQELRAQGLPEPIGMLYGGGCALSVVSNSEIANLLDIPIYVPPFAHDASQFVGAAIHASLASGSEWEPGGGWSSLIPEHTSGQATVDGALEKGLSGDRVTPADVAARLSQGHIIGRISGGSEAGPRALGNRSLLGNGSDRSMVDRINSEVKKREWYRPLAPMIRDEDFTSFLDGSATPASAYMLDAFRVKPKHRASLRSVCGPDGLTRAQSITSDTPFLSDLCKEMGALTGYPVLLNTSLNGPGRTTAFDVEQALVDANDLNLDGLLVEDMLIDGRDIARYVGRSG